MAALFFHCFLSDARFDLRSKRHFRSCCWDYEPRLCGKARLVSSRYLGHQKFGGGRNHIRLLCVSVLAPWPRTPRLRLPLPHPCQRNVHASTRRRRNSARWSLRWSLTGKATNSKAVGGTPPTALPSSPIRTVFSDGNRRDVATGQ